MFIYLLRLFVNVNPNLYLFRHNLKMSQNNYRGKRKYFDNKNKSSYSRNKQNNRFQSIGQKKDRPKAEQLSELEVGITEYIREETGFSGIIKARFSDFHVSEIDCEGKVAKLTDISVPEYFNQGLVVTVIV